MRAGVEQVFALQINFRAAKFSCQSLGEVKRRRSAAKFLQIILELALELGVFLRAVLFVLQFLQRMHQRFGHKTSAVWTEVAPDIRKVRTGNCIHAGRLNDNERARKSESGQTVNSPCPAQSSACSAAAFATATNFRTFEVSFFPGADSTPLDTSTA